MLRDPALVPLSHQHQHALALCVRIERGLRDSRAGLGFWQTEIVRQFEAEIRHHFEAEERELFPAAARIHELAGLIQQLRTDHVHLRAEVEIARAGRLDAAALLKFGAALAAHVRREERELFERLQQMMTGEELLDLGARLEAYFRAAGITTNGF